MNERVDNSSDWFVHFAWQTRGFLVSIAIAIDVQG
jgi:hypothetical protein